MKTEYLLQREVDQVLSVLTERNRLIMRTALHTGLRVGDVLKLEKDQLKPHFWVTETKHGFGTGHLLTEGRLDNYVHVNIHEVNVLHIQIRHCSGKPSGNRILRKRNIRKASDCGSPSYTAPALSRDSPRNDRAYSCGAYGVIYRISCYEVCRRT